MCGVETLECVCRPLQATAGDSRHSFSFLIFGYKKIIEWFVITKPKPSQPGGGENGTAEPAEDGPTKATQRQCG